MTCDHDTVTRGILNGAPIWTCTECADQFIPIGPVPPMSVHVAQVPAHEIEVMITVWPRGNAELATRPLDSTWSWGPPIEMEKR